MSPFQEIANLSDEALAQLELITRNMFALGMDVVARKCGKSLDDFKEYEAPPRTPRQLRESYLAMAKKTENKSV